MTRDTLRGLGLTDEQVAQVLALRGQEETAHQSALEVARRELSEARAAIEAGARTDSIRAALGGYRLHDEDTVLALLDQRTIAVDGQSGQITGLKEQMDALKTGKPFLFLDAADGRGGAEITQGGAAPRDMNRFLRGGN